MGAFVFETREEEGKFITYARIGELSSAIIKCLISIQVLTESKDADIMIARILRKFYYFPRPNLQILVEE